MLTIDVITPLVDDPKSFGRISAANALSDVYAMGGTPQAALSFVGLPESLGLEVLHAVMLGMSEKAKEAGCAIVGGHTLRDTEPKCGLAVVGSIQSGTAWTHARARSGQALVLTKPLGTGIIAQALRAERAEAAVIAAAVRSMEQLNQAACDAGREHDVTAATDVTGFGLLGHLGNLLDASKLGARLFTREVPLLPNVLQLASEGLLPGGSQRNLRDSAARLKNREAVDPLLLSVLCDAQTSGGLLLTVPPRRVDSLLQALGPNARAIGELYSGDPGAIVLLP